MGIQGSLIPYSIEGRRRGKRKKEGTEKLGALTIHYEKIITILSSLFSILHSTRLSYSLFINVPEWNLLRRHI